MIYLETHSTDPGFNLAAEEYVLTDKKEGTYLMLWQNDRTVVVGRNQNAAEEINAPFVEEHGIRVVRRTTGGGAVYHDLGNLNYSFITDRGDETQSIRRFTDPVCRALGTLGLNAQTSGRNDILIDGKKVSGIAERIVGNRILHHGCLLFDTDRDMLTGALKVNREKYESKGIKSVSSRVANIRQLLMEDMDLSRFWELLKKELLSGGTAEESFTEEERKRIEQDANAKYRTWEWTYGKSPAFTFRNSRRFGGGTVDVRLEVKEGIIRDGIIYGDFMAKMSQEPFMETLRGTRYDQKAVAKLLSETDLPMIFGTVTKEELLETLFPAADNSV